jgi:2-oxoglutarate/2-oxoacid ferredoxin oxidoreductase subunit beta
MSRRQLISPAENTWCPGCGNFSIQHMMKAALLELSDEELPLENVVLVSGIGCHGKMADYLDLNSFYAIHGRGIPVATGIKLANPDLKVICFSGDGDAYAEGLDHLIFAAKRNLDITVIVHNNRVYGLTTGQYTPTSPLGYKGRSTPAGTVERPINPLHLVLASGGTYIARGYTRNLPLLKRICREAVMHRGFSFVDVLQICASYYDIHEYYDSHVYEIADHDTGNYDGAERRILEWDYTSDAPIALGTFYRRDMPSFEDMYSRPVPPAADREAIIRNLVERSI